MSQLSKRNVFDEAVALCEEYVSDHPGCGLRELQEYVLHQTGLKLETIRKARKQSTVTLVRAGKNWKCYLRDPEADVDTRGWVRVFEMLPKAEWQKIMSAFRAGQVEFVVVRRGAEVLVDGDPT